MSENNGQPSVVKTLKEFNSTIGLLTLEDRKNIVEQAILLMEQLYVHLPLKSAIHGVDPVRQLKIVRRRLDELTQDKLIPEINFHKEMLDIFTSLRDGHTNYMLPKPFSYYYAVLPFLVESYVDKDDNTHFLVTQIGFPDWLNVPSNLRQSFPPTFKVGVEIEYWNGVPIHRAVDINANKNYGSNPSARFARGLEAMTIRPMSLSLPPEEEWVVIGYLTEDGKGSEFRLEWTVVSPIFENVDTGRSSKAKYAYRTGIDLTTDLVRKMKQTLFAPKDVMASARQLARGKVEEQMTTTADGLNTVFKQWFRAKKISDNIGYIRIFTFAAEDVNVNYLVDEFSRLIMQLPKK
jgi:hypothetical protein